MRSTHSGRRASAAVASGLAAGMLVAPGAAMALPQHHRGSHCSQSRVPPIPHLSMRRARGGALATISLSRGASGYVRLSVRPGRTYAVDVSHGGGSQLLPTKPGTTYHVTATFWASGQGCVVAVSDSATYRNGWVRGADSLAGGKPDLKTDLKLASSGTLQPPAAVTSAASGPDFTTALLGVLGLGLVGAGAASVAVNRRRDRAAS